MLAKSLRLSKRDIARLYQKGRIVRDNFLLLRVLPNHLDYNRYSVIISKKIVAKAVVRTRLKRKTFIILSNQQIPKSFDIIISFIKLPEGEIEPKLIKVFENIKKIIK